LDAAFTRWTALALRTQSTCRTDLAGRTRWAHRTHRTNLTLRTHGSWDTLFTLRSDRTCWTDVTLNTGRADPSTFVIDDELPTH